MNKNEVLKKLQEIFCDVLDNEEIQLTIETTAEDVEEWDSLTNIQLVVAIEHEFGIRFTSSEIPSWKNIGDMVTSIIKKV